MITQVAELETDRHVKMTMTEFIDVFGRIADKLNIQVIIFSKIMILAKSG